VKRDQKFPPGYVALVERLGQLIEQWCGEQPGLPDLKWLDPGDTMFIGGLQGKAVDFLVDSPDARRLVEWLDVQTERKATLFQLTMALRFLGHLPRGSGGGEKPPRRDPTTRLESSPCPRCGAVLDAATSLGGYHVPKPGDITLCATCGGFLVFGEGLRLETLSPESFAALPSQNQEELERARAALYAARSGKPGAKAGKVEA
jgi:hypothetical protein